MIAAAGLRVVDNEMPDPPYPVDVRAKGWVFELDITRVKNSDTWTITPVELRPWLLMLWACSWERAPAGSLPSDDEVIAAIIGMPWTQFAAHRSFLMRGWYLCSDGRMYHPVITELVEKMMGSRRKDRERKALRSKSIADRLVEPPIQPQPAVAKTRFPAESDGIRWNPTESAAGTGTGTGTGEINTAPRKRAASPPATIPVQVLVELGVAKQVAEDWLRVRRTKSCPLTLTALEAVQREAAAAGMTLAQAVLYATENNWAGFKSDWVDKPDTKKPNPGPSVLQEMRAHDERIRALRESDPEYDAKIREMIGGVIKRMRGV